MRIKSNNPLEIVRSAVQQHVGQFWTAANELTWLWGTEATIPEPVRKLYVDESMTRRGSISSLSKRICLACDGDIRFLVAGLLAPQLPNAEVRLLLTTEARVLIAIQTDAAFRADGVFQVSGHEMGITLLTGEQFLAQRGRRFYRGQSLQGISLEVSDGAGGWVPENIRLSLPSHLIESVQLPSE